MRNDRRVNHLPLFICISINTAGDYPEIHGDSFVTSSKSSRNDLNVVSSYLHPGFIRAWTITARDRDIQKAQIDTQLCPVMGGLAERMTDHFIFSHYA